MPIRQPSDLDLYYTYWRLGLENMADAIRWRQARESELSFWPNIEMIFPGFWRYKYLGHSSKMQHVRGQFIPLATWIEQQTNDDGELITDEEIIVKSGWFKPIHANSDYLGETSLLMAWHSCRMHPVSEQMYQFAMDTYARESRYVWYDTPEVKAAPAIKRTEIKSAPSLF